MGKREEKIQLPSQAWISLLWAQYNKLSEPLKEGFISLAQSMVKETENQKPGQKAQKNTEKETANGYLL